MNDLERSSFRRRLVAAANLLGMAIVAPPLLVCLAIATLFGGARGAERFTSWVDRITGFRP